jgi:hypothetical protein
MVGFILTTFLANATIHMEEKIALTFRGIGYVHRYSKGNLHEYTPKGKPDLKSWVDMITINDYPTVKSGEQLAKSANSVLSTYKNHKGDIIETSSIPRTANKEAEHVIVVMFPTGETAFARFMMVGGHGHSIVYSHRTSGKNIEAAMNQWITKNGGGCEGALMGMTSVPKH